MPSMNKTLPAILLFLVMPFGALAETQQGLELAPQAMRQKHLDHFMDVYRQFCYERHSRETVKSLLLASGGFRPAEDFEGVFEEMFDGLSYAVTPDPEFCTVDVMLSYEEKRLLFSQQDIETAVGALPGNYRVVERTRETHEGPDGEQVRVEVSEFLRTGSDGNRILLVYPLSNQDVYYMTLDYYYE